MYWIRSGAPTDLRNIYESYVDYCRSVDVPPAIFENWLVIRETMGFYWGGNN